MSRCLPDIHLTSIALVQVQRFSRDAGDTAERSCGNRSEREPADRENSGAHLKYASVAHGKKRIASAAQQYFPSC
jgi:hypothetical protein